MVPQNEEQRSPSCNAQHDDESIKNNATDLTSTKSSDEDVEVNLKESSHSHDDNNIKGKSLSRRVSRLLALVLGLSTLAIILYGLLVFLNHKGIHWRKSERSDFETLRSMDEVSAHDVPEDCWMVLDGTVYDLTDYEHPGGMAYIYGRCGRDGTSGFDASHSRYYLPIISRFSKGKLQEEETDTSILAETAPEPAVPEPAPVSLPVSVPVPAPALNPTVTEQAPQTPPPTQSPEPFCISLDEVQLHSVPEDCYYVLYGDVFDFTLYIDEHPGGPKHVEDECGTDATVMFETAKKHDMDLLLKKKGYDYYLAPAC